MREAATVMVVRDSELGLEVLMLRRSLDSAFAGDAFVFPGGVLDLEDRNPELADFCCGRSDQDASRRLGVASGGLAYWVGAARECFEEAGVLLANDGFGPLSLSRPDIAERYRRHRRQVHDGVLGLGQLCRTEGLLIDVGRMEYFSHWVTPAGYPRRYDTRFFLAVAPEEQVALHDDGETVANVWVKPAEALDRHKQGLMKLMYPTVASLVALTAYSTSTEALAAAKAVHKVPDYLPVLDSEGRAYLP